MRQYKASAVLVAAVILAASACGSGKPAVARAQPGGAILGMVAATSITGRGVPVHPSFTFPPAQPQITVIALVGKVRRSPLTFTWYRVTGAGARKLFSRTVQVAAWDRAYSIGKDPGPLATGTYKVTASAGGQAQATTVTVARPAQSPSAIENGTAPPGQPPVDGGGGVIAPPAQPAADQSEITCLGADDTWCDADPGTDYSRPSVNVLLGAATPVGKTAAILVSANDKLISTLDVKGQAQSVVTFDPCSVPGGKDLPGTTFRVEAFSAQTVPKQRVVTIGLGDDTSAPSLHVVSTPARGSKVKPGDAITLKVTATEDGPSWQTGVKLIQVTGPEGLVADSGAPYGGVAKSCGQKSWTQTFTATYTVPSHPQPLIRLCAITEDFAGNQNFQCGEWYTGKVWKGPIHIDASITGNASDSGTADGQAIVVEDASGHLTGTVTVSRTSGCTRYPPFLQTVKLHVTGQDTNGRLVLHATPASPILRTTGICGFPDGVTRPPTEVHEPGGSPYEPFVVTITSPTTAQGTGSGVDADYGSFLHWRYTIKLTSQG